LRIRASGVLKQQYALRRSMQAERIFDLQ
jgi:hypothetical protein